MEKRPQAIKMCALCVCASETPCQSEKATTNVVHTKRAIYKNQKKTSEWLNVNDIWYSFRQKKIYLHTFFKSNVSHEHHFSVGIMPLIPNKYEQIKLVFCFIQWTSVHYSQCQRAIERDPIDNDNKLTNNNQIALQNLKILFSKQIYNHCCQFFALSSNEYPYNMCPRCSFPFNALISIIRRKISIFHVINRQCIKYCQKLNESTSAKKRRSKKPKKSHEISSPESAVCCDNIYVDLLKQ